VKSAAQTDSLGVMKDASFLVSLVICFGSLFGCTFHCYFATDADISFFRFVLHLYFGNFFHIDRNVQHAGFSQCFNYQAN
jgi:hypothetical protein